MTLCLICREEIDHADAGSYLLTCSTSCHERFVEELIRAFGEFKVVIGPDAIPRLVPTRDIIEKGVKVSELDKYPKAGFG